MKLRNIFFATLITLFFSENIHAQYLIVTDPDGYTNVREKPNANSKILGQLFHTDHFYEADCDYGNDPAWNVMYETNWTPIQVEVEDKKHIGYVYQPNIIAIYDLPELKYKVIDSLSVMYFDTEIQIHLKLQNIHTSKYAKQPALADNDNSYVIEKMKIKYGKEENNIPSTWYSSMLLNENHLKYHAPGEIRTTDGTHQTPLFVHKGKDDLYYLGIKMKDGGDARFGVWIIKGKEIIAYNESGLCSNPFVKLHKVEE